MKTLKKIIDEAVWDSKRNDLKFEPYKGLKLNDHTWIDHIAEDTIYLDSHYGCIIDPQALKELLRVSKKLKITKIKAQGRDISDYKSIHIEIPKHKTMDFEDLSLETDQAFTISSENPMSIPFSVTLCNLNVSCHVFRVSFKYKRGAARVDVNLNNVIMHIKDKWMTRIENGHPKLILDDRSDIIVGNVHHSGDSANLIFKDR